jgi:hypothetical protein
MDQIRVQFRPGTSDVAAPHYVKREIHIEIGKDKTDLSDLYWEQGMEFAVLLRPLCAMACTERGGRQNQLHMHILGEYLLPPGDLGITLIRNLVQGYFGTDDEPCRKTPSGYTIYVSELNARRNNANGNMQTMEAMTGYLAKYFGNPDFKFWVYNVSEKDVLLGISEYEKKACNYYYYKDASVLNRGNLCNEVWSFTNRFFTDLVDEGLTSIEALRFMLIYPIEKYRLSMEWGKMNMAQDMIKTQLIYYWSFLLPSDREEIFTCEQLSFVIGGRHFIDENYLFRNAGIADRIRQTVEMNAIDFNCIDLPYDHTDWTRGLPHKTACLKRWVRTDDCSRYDRELMGFWQGSTLCIPGREPWAHNQERNWHLKPQDHDLA